MAVLRQIVEAILSRCDFRNSITPARKYCISMYVWTRRDGKFTIILCFNIYIHIMYLVTSFMH